MTDRGWHVQLGDWWERRAATRWVARVHGDPSRYGAAFRRWQNRRPDRAHRIADIEATLRELQPAARLMAASDHHAPIRHTGRRRIPMVGAAALAGGGLLAMVGLSHGVMGVSQPAATEIGMSGGTPIGRVIRYNTARDEVRALALPDGSRVRLGPNSAMTAAFNGQERHITLFAGQARFDVAHDPARPFRVEARGTIVTAIGTIFDVAIAQQLHVSLIQGVVDVQWPAGPSGATHSQIVRLLPGRHVEVPIPVSAAMTPSGPGVTGTEAMAVRSFDDVPLGRIIALANARSTRRIELADPALARQEVFGQFEIDDIQNVAEKLARLLDLKLDQPSPDRIILHR